MNLSASFLDAFREHPLGLCGHREDAGCVGDVEDVEHRLRVLALGVILDTNYISAERWSALVNVSGHWLLDPARVAYQPSSQIGDAMQGLGIAGPKHIARVWWQICRGVQGRFQGAWRDLFRVNDDHTLKTLAYLGRNRSTFPVLSGPIISARWLDLVHRLGGVPLQDWEALRVKLPAAQGGAARLFGVDTDLVHPLFARAFHAWLYSCKGQKDGFCGFGDCPRRR